MVSTSSTSFKRGIECVIIRRYSDRLPNCRWPHWLAVCLFEPWDKVPTITNMSEAPCFAATNPQPQSVQPVLVQSCSAEASRRIWSGLLW